MKIDLSIIITNYNTKELLKKLLFSIKKSILKSFKIETIVVDNASADDSTKMVEKNFPLVNLIINKKNLGYAKANNKGIKKAKGKYILLLNSDTLLNKNTLFKIIEFMEKNKEYAAVTCKVELSNGQIDPACHRGFPTPWAAFTYFSTLEKIFSQSKIFGQYHQTWKDLSQIHQVDVISGAFFMIRKDVFEKVGFLDERFFMYAEDIDLCLRLKKKGYKIAYNPGTKIIHYKKSSGRKKGKGKEITQKDVVIRRKSSKYFFETMKLFYVKHYKNQYPWIIRQLVLLGIWIVGKIKK